LLPGEAPKIAILTMIQVDHPDVDRPRNLAVSSGAERTSRPVKALPMIMR